MYWRFQEALESAMTESAGSTAVVALAANVRAFSGDLFVGAGMAAENRRALAGVVDLAGDCGCSSACDI